jgi:hypothetical protein
MQGDELNHTSEKKNAATTTLIIIVRSVAVR